ncbi:MAG: hypothetical protein HXX08_03570 [Chloroflexi bacterium]|uniref:Uncharacterized protein n=1 Tax=Candidatus Chlorohelix allophototropha TaxID=3003348 RepID=A0A8T7M213_9CHLR|nr:hypothetical protein [Chloroflexota bacterium]WJW66817.1 hypothetical protein OZ401_000062 [Chloroflexota bacterium L227-S17]
MSDQHIDIDDVDAPKASSKKEQVFDDYDSGDTGSGDPYRVWGFERMPEMVRDFSDKIAFRVRDATDDAIPEDARRLFRNAQREFLLGWRKVIDYQLERIRTQEELERSRRARTQESSDTSIKIEIEED